MQGTWKTKKKYFQKDKFKQIVKTIRYLNPQEFKELIQYFNVSQSYPSEHPITKSFIYYSDC